MSFRTRSRRGHILRILRLREMIAKRLAEEHAAQAKPNDAPTRRVSHAAAPRSSSVHR